MVWIVTLCLTKSVSFSIDLSEMNSFTHEKGIEKSFTKEIKQIVCFEQA